MPTNTRDTFVDAISSITHDHIMPDLANQVETSNPFIMKLEKTTVSGGNDIRQPLIYKRGVRTKYSGSEVLNTSYQEKKFTAIFDWKQYDVPVIITGIDRLKSSGPEAVIDHLKSETEAAKSDMMDLFATGVYSDGSDSKDIEGAQVFLSTSNTYGGISQSANSWWQAKVDSTTTAFSLNKLNENFESAREDNDKPNLIVFSQTQYNNFWGSLEPSKRYTDEDTAKAGFTNLVFNGAICVEDSYAPDDYIIGYNLKHLKLVSHKDRNFPGKLEDFIKPHDQDIMVGHIFWAGNLVCKQPRKQFAMTGLT